MGNWANTKDSEDNNISPPNNMLPWYIIQLYIAKKTNVTNNNSDNTKNNINIPAAYIPAITLYCSIVCEHENFITGHQNKINTTKKDYKYPPARIIYCRRRE